MGRPLQILTVDGTKDEESFVLDWTNLDYVVSKIPVDMKVAVLSVVGAFRSGKSFLLNFFIRYLRDGNPDDLSEEWMKIAGLALTEGNLNASSQLADEVSNKSASSSFAWRGGQERQTTGIWMWSEPFIRRTASSHKEDIAVLLMDTQGMFDNETSMTLTAQIFGLSTFISSYQIYNVDKRLQEDNLQHLALFSEYGRLALASPHQYDAESAVVTAEGAADAPDAALTAEDSEERMTLPAEQATMSEAYKSEDAAGVDSVDAGTDCDRKPFQKFQFLVRDWQNFDGDFDPVASPAEKDDVYFGLRKEMGEYLAKVLNDREIGDLQSTREQITRCFAQLDCFLMPHPGFAVTKKNFCGTIDKMEPFFLSMVNRYVRLIFDEELEPKMINGRYLTSRSLRTYLEEYVRVFQKDSRGFPKAMTMLDATAEANNRSAADEAIDSYARGFSEVAGLGAQAATGTDAQAQGSYIRESTLKALHASILAQVLKEFDSSATMGSSSRIKHYREKLLSELERERSRVFLLNAARNPFRDLEVFVVPAIIGAGAWAIATLFDFVCTTDHCEAVEDTFKNMYMFLGFGMLILAYRNPFRDAVMYLVPLGAALTAWILAAVLQASCDSPTCLKTVIALRRVYLFVFFALIMLAYKNFSSLAAYVKAVQPILAAGGSTNTNKKES